jgi:hypothetical protein
MSWIDQVPDGIAGGAMTVDGEVPVRTVEPRLFREAMSRIGTAVHVVATGGVVGKAGFTATAVASVSDAPPDAARLPQHREPRHGGAEGQRRDEREHAARGRGGDR